MDSVTKTPMSERMQEHTPGRLSVGATWPQLVAIYAGSLYVAHAVRNYSASEDEFPARPTEAEAQANARRIAACWNACAGISTEALEKGPSFAELVREFGTVSEWRPIATAPKDGTWVALTDGVSVAAGFWGGTSFGSGTMTWLSYAHRSDYEKVDLAGAPILWQPLPALPSAPSSGDPSPESGAAEGRTGVMRHEHDQNGYCVCGDMWTGPHRQAMRISSLESENAALKAERDEAVRQRELVMAYGDNQITTERDNLRDQLSEALKEAERLKEEMAQAAAVSKARRALSFTPSPSPVEEIATISDQHLAALPPEEQEARLAAFERVVASVTQEPPPEGKTCGVKVKYESAWGINMEKDCDRPLPCSVPGHGGEGDGA